METTFLFELVMDRLTDKTRQESLWTMFLADCCESREHVEEESLGRRRYVLVKIKLVGAR